MTTTRVLQRILVVLLAGVLALGTACGDDDETEETESAGQQTATTAPAVTTTVPATTTSTTTAGNTITIQGFAFSGIDSARSGSNWTVVNRDSAPHTVTADDDSFNFQVAGGETKSFTQRLAPGSYPIHCNIHPSRMRGTLVVT
jgi:plastocyanin